MTTSDTTISATELRLDGARLRQLRRERGFSARSLAGRTGLCLRQIWRLEAGHRPNVRAVTVARIARALSTTMDYLMGLTDEPTPCSFNQRVTPE